MPKIAVLPAALASQIAAGEVVERPASALKELLENSLDAGAERCDVEIEGGGITRLRVRDDGCGIAADEAVLALSRHATSKLQRFEDLDDLPSFGFRGEALPSIASVSRFSLETRTADADAGMRVVVEGGGEPVVSPIGMAPGTAIEMRDLFYNVPARRKFLRSSGTESGHIGEVMENAALACPSVTFTLTRDGRKSKQWLRAPGRAERVADALKDKTLAHCVGERGPLRIEAFLGRPEQARSGANALKLFCNERPIRDRAVLGTIAQAFGSVLERGRYPYGVVYLNLPPQLVDINVHPQKSEVRFADQRAVCDALFQLLSTQLAASFSLPVPSRNRFATAPPKTAVSPEGPSAAGGPLAAGPTLAPSPQRRPTSPRPSLRLADVPAARSAGHLGPPSLFTLRDAPATPRAASEQEEETAATLRPSAPDEGAQEPATTDQGEPWSSLRFVGQMRRTFLVCEGATGVYILDQHAAAERITFHQVQAAYRAGTIGSQTLLFPETFRAEPAWAELVEHYGERIQRLGFDLRTRGSETLSVHAVPRLLHREPPASAATDLLRELQRDERAHSTKEDHYLATLACRGSLRAGDAVSEQEAQALLKGLDGVDFAANCPHGRPVVTFTPWSELERRVGRR